MKFMKKSVQSHIDKILANIKDGNTPEWVNDKRAHREASLFTIVSPVCEWICTFSMFYKSLRYVMYLPI